MHFDFCILGSGFSGSLMAWILARHGRKVVLIDRGSHPRFAIGESSTPLADYLLEQIATEFQLPELTPLSRWGSWQENCPELRAGKKRGFSYYAHRDGRAFVEGRQHESSLLVAASENDQQSDTHWMRSDVDAWLCKQAMQAGAEFIGGFTDTRLSRPSGDVWLVAGQVNKQCVEVSCDFLIDASGSGALVGNYLNLESFEQRLQTRTGALFGHFTGVGSMSAWMQKHRLSLAEDPFDGDDAAQHHLMTSGWMWMLRFADGTTSVGMVQSTDKWLSRNTSSDVRAQWDGLIARYPTLRDLMQAARLVAPCQLDGTPRLGWLPKMSRLWGKAAGEGWAMLPGTVGVVDPLHSTGIAHGLSGVQRLSCVLLGSSASRQFALQVYSHDVVREVLWIDRIVSTCYLAAEDSFELFRAACSLYFVAAIHSERELAGCGQSASGFLLSQCMPLRNIVHAAELRIAQQSRSEQSNADRRLQRSEIGKWLRESLKPWNDVGLMDPDLRNRIWRSSAKK